jgi:hypothetical protein
MEQAEQKALFLLRLLAQKMAIDEYAPRAASLLPENWREDAESLLARELANLHPRLSKESRYLDKLSVIPQNTSQADDPLYLRALNAMFPDNYDDNSCEIIEEMYQDLSSDAESYVSRASMAFRNFARQKFALPLKYLVMELEAKLSAQA